MAGRYAEGWGRAVVGTLAAERERWILWLPVAIGAGVAFYFALPFEPATWAGPAVLFTAVLVGAALRKRTLPVVLALSVGAFATGFTLAKLRTAYVEAPVLAKRLGPVAVRGRVVFLEARPDGARLTLERPEIEGLAIEETPERVRVRVRGDSAKDAAIGARVELRAILLPPSEPVAPGAFDFSRQAYFEGLGGMGFALGRIRTLDPSGAARRGAGAADSLALWLADLRYRVTGRILTALPGETGAIAAALLTGERGTIPEETWEAMRVSGLAHLLAISGLHIGLVAGILFFGVRGVLAAIEPLAVRYPIKKWTALVAIVGAFAYLLLSGATVPTQRAFLMIGLVFLAILLDRTGISMRLIAWAAVVVLALAPESLLGPSFQMSFGAVIALIAAYEAASRRLPLWREAPWWKRAGIYLIGVGFTTLVASAATAPFALYHFNRFPAYGLAANLVAVPLTALWIMPWGVVSLLLMPAGLEALALVPMGAGIDGVVAVAKEVTGWRGAVTRLPAMPTAGLLSVVAGGLWLCLWRQRWRRVGLLGIAAGALAFLFVRPPDVLVSGDGRLLAVRTGEGELLLSSLRRGRWSAEQWLGRAGLEEGAPWPGAGEGTENRELSCDPLGCLFRKAGHTVALVNDGGALPEDCRTADVVVAVVPVRLPCPSASVVIDRFDLWRGGGHALWLESDGVRVETVREGQGDRPWSRPPR